MKKFLFILLLGLIVLPYSTSAISVINVNQVKEKISQQLNKTKTSEQKLADLKTKGEQMIDKRMLDLTRAKTQLSVAKLISETVKNDLMQAIETVIKELNALKEEIAQETDYAALKEKVQSIVLDYRIYAVFLPQGRGLAVVDRLNNLVNTINALNQKIQEKLTALSGQGFQVSEIQTLLSGVDENISSAKDLIAAAEKDWASLDIKDVKAAQGLKLSAKQKMTEAQAKLITVKQDLAQAVAKIKAIMASNKPAKTTE